MLKKTILSLSLLMLMPSAQAHRQWLLPSSTQIDAKEAWVTIDGAVSENVFDFDTNALSLDNLDVIAPDGSQIKAEAAIKTKFRSSVDIKLPQKGTYKISQNAQSVMATYRLNGEEKRWRGTEEKMAQEIPADATDIKVSRTYSRLETYVTNDTANDTVLKATGTGLELVPLTNPTELFAQETTRFKVLLEGKPVPDSKVSVIAGGVRYRGVLNEITAVSDKDGIISIKWPFAGMYWLKAAYPQLPDMVDGKRPPMPEKRYSYAATVEVLLP
ncbi:DUF4198 domain-containing protein [Agitococcus lubricus]|uniref:Putative GH25 family protein n=1 Tax=Agitococcus lubricus TaxID=1077255 RepID=A0A2T5IZB7_9GAMM|nr:DUF4198 domain-containing protein [Agitococcus lubricus]PTQ89355.1 putative GH25 family protein [Agitococcus lubricus]